MQVAGVENIQRAGPGCCPVRDSVRGRASQIRVGEPQGRVDPCYRHGRETENRGGGLQSVVEQD